MGNRAVITASETKNAAAIYVHWNGGSESVLAFLAAAKQLGHRCPTQDSYGMARLAQVIGNFFGGTCSVGIGPLSAQDTDNGDNGTYVIGPGWTIAKRLHAPAGDPCTTYDELLPIQKEKHDGIVAHVLMLEAAMQAAREAAEKAEAVAA